MLFSSIDAKPAEHALSTEPQAAAAVQDAREPGYDAVPLLQSEALLQGCKRVHIAHNGARYQLQTTRQGKLILTK